MDTIRSNNCSLILAVSSVVLCLRAVTSPAAAGEIRTWTDATGEFSVEAELVSVDAETVRLKKSDGKEIDVPISKLSESDRAFIADRKVGETTTEADTEGANAKPPTELPRVSVKSLREEAKADLRAFKAKRVGMTVEVEGIIGTFGWDIRGRDHVGMVFLDDSTDDLDPGVICLRSNNSFRPWNQYQTGKTGIVRGKVALSRINEPFLEDSEFVWSESGGMPRITAEDVVAAFLSDADSAKMKFHDEYFVINGKVLGYIGEDRERRLILRGKDNTNFEVHCDALEARSFSDLAAGTEVFLFGHCQIGGIFLNHEKVGAAMCERLPVPNEKAE